MWKKRALDLVLTTLGAIVWVPVVLVASLLVLVKEGRPVYYRSTRRVSTHRVVRLVKFRTMVRDAEKLVNRDTVPVEGGTRFLNISPDSPLYTPIGRTLERFAITELPQLVHVWRGQMSVVGNRPLPQNVMDSLREEYPYVDDRFLTSAGLTGPAQLVGREALSDAERLTLEATYCRACVAGYTVRLDLAILFSTIFGVLGLTKGLDYQGVLDLIERHTRVRRGRVVVSAQDAASAVRPESAA